MEDYEFNQYLKIKRNHELMMIAYKIMREDYIPSDEEYEELIEYFIENEMYESITKTNEKLNK